jgi:hypothetical protein
MKQILAMVGATFMTAAACVSATDALPVYDIERLCQWQEDVRWMRGNRKLHDAEEFSDCLDRDRRAYNSLQQLWPQLPTEIKTLCQAVAATHGPPSYWMMEVCVQLELKKARREGQFSLDRNSIVTVMGAGPVWSPADI